MLGLLCYDMLKDGFMKKQIIVLLILTILLNACASVNEITPEKTSANNEASIETELSIARYLTVGGLILLPAGGLGAIANPTAGAKTITFGMMVAGGVLPVSGLITMIHGSFFAR